VLLLGVLLLALTACAGADDSEAPGLDGGAACEFTGSMEVVGVERVGGPFQISEVRHEVIEPGCEERVVFIYESLPDGAEFGYDAFYRDGPFIGPAGEIEVAGEAILEVVLFEAQPDDESAEPRRAGDAELVLDIVQAPAIPGGSVWLIGLERERPFTVSVERTPEPALIVTIGAPDDS
jgi:hypothetical protein